MKIAAIITIALAGLCPAEEDQDQSIVRFSNGDQLTGSMLGLTLDKLNWKSEILNKPAEFGLEHVLELNMPATMETADVGEAGHEAVLGMTNGDSIRGQITGLKDDEIRLNTWYAGELVFRRVNVKSVKITRTSDVYYRGPGGMEGWVYEEDQGGWSYKSGALISDSSGGIAREIDFPAESKIAFDASWRGAFRPRIIFYSNDVKSTSPDAGYEMVFQGNSVHLKRSGSNTWIGHSTKAGVLREQEKARIEIRTSLKTGKILLFVDDEFIDMWEDEKVDADSLGKGFHFISQDNAPLRISNILVSEWDGYTDDVPKQQDQFQGRGIRGGFGFEDDFEKKDEEEVLEGRMVLSNGDTIEGEVMGIEGDMIKVKTPLSEVTFPIYRLKNIVLKPADMETPILLKGDVRATFADGSRMVFRLDKVRDKKLVGFSQNFGQAEFSKDAFRRIEFNIHDSKMKDMRRSEDW